MRLYLTGMREVKMAKIVDDNLKKLGLHVSKPLLAVICIVFGVLLLIFPNMVGIIIGIFLLVQGILVLLEYYHNRKILTQRNYKN
jgi:uncharacterized membrane protein HdeD (DUF308 family)